MGMAQARIQLRAETTVCKAAANPGSDVLLLEPTAGGSSPAGRGARPKAAMLAAGGPKRGVDPATGREHYVPGPARYTADIMESTTFFTTNVRQLAEDAPLYDPHVRTIALLRDGGEWVHHGWPPPEVRDRVNVVEILDIRHREEHGWKERRPSGARATPKPSAGRSNPTIR